MAVAVSRKQAEYVLDEDKILDPTEQTKFLIRPLSAKQYAEVQGQMEISGDRISGSYYINVLRYGLAGWSNFRDGDKNEVKFHPKNMDENIDCLSVPNRYELTGAIMELSVLGEQKEKN